MYANVRNSDVLVRRRIGITTVPATFGPAGDWLNEYCRGRKSSSTDDFRFVRCRFLLPRCYACAAVFLQRPTGIKFLSLFLLSLYTHTHTHTQHTHTHTHRYTWVLRNRQRCCTRTCLGRILGLPILLVHYITVPCADIIIYYISYC